MRPPHTVWTLTTVCFTPLLFHDSFVCSDGHVGTMIYPAGLIMTFCIFFIFQKHLICSTTNLSPTLCGSLKSVKVSNLSFTLISMKCIVPLGRVGKVILKMLHKLSFGSLLGTTVREVFTQLYGHFGGCSLMHYTDQRYWYKHGGQNIRNTSQYNAIQLYSTTNYSL